MRPRAFVTGATGFVGANLVRELIDRDWEVHALARVSSSVAALAGLPVKVHRGDLLDRPALERAVPSRVEAVFHVAASTNFWSGRNAAQTRTNVDGTVNLIEAARRVGARRFVHTSSFVTWGIRDGPLSETSPRTTDTDWINYVRTKHAGEQCVEEAARSGNLDTVILNPAHILGPGDRHNWARLFRMIHERKLPGVPPGGGNFCDVRDVARAHVQAFHRAGSGEKYLLGGEYARFVDLIAMAGERLRRKVPSRPMPAWLMKGWARVIGAGAYLSRREPQLTPEAAAMVCASVECDSSKARRELDYRIRPLPTMVEDTIEWMRKNGLLS